jgi:hypothetical protein
MEINLTTPALLFPALSLLLLAYTNRFLALAALIRNLHERYRASHDVIIIGQIRNLRLRMQLIKNMQAAGIVSILTCVICMFVLFAGHSVLGKWFFGAALVALILSLLLSLWEIWISVGALNLQLRDIESEDSARSTSEPPR